MKTYVFPIALTPFILFGCFTESSLDVDSGSDNEVDTNTDSDAGTDAATDTDTNTDFATCQALFGTPSDKTGLDENECQPSCDCEGVSFAPPKYSTEQIDTIASKELLNPPALLDADPYEAPELDDSAPDRVCAVIFEDGDSNAYRLETFEDSKAADDAGAKITHHGACGMCSSLESLAVYIRHGDLTDPVRECGILGLASGEEANMDCLQELGFDLPCAQIWYYNTKNTRVNCLTECLDAMELPYHLEDGSPNDCIQCDEDNSGPVFKAVSGRTRRNSGLPTALCRPCDTVAPVIHDYP